MNNCKHNLEQEFGLFSPQRQQAITLLPGRELAALVLFAATTAVTFLVHAVTWTHVDGGPATGLAVSSAAVVAFLLVWFLDVDPG